MKRPKKAGAARRRNTVLATPHGEAPPPEGRPSPVLNTPTLFTREDLRLQLRALKGYSENGGVSRKQMNLIQRMECLLGEYLPADHEDGETHYPLIPMSIEDL